MNLHAWHERFWENRIYAVCCELFSEPPNFSTEKWKMARAKMSVIRSGHNVTVTYCPDPAVTLFSEFYKFSDGSQHIVSHARQSRHKMSSPPM